MHDKVWIRCGLLLGVALSAIGFFVAQLMALNTAHQRLQSTELNYQRQLKQLEPLLADRPPMAPAAVNESEIHTLARLLTDDTSPSVERERSVWTVSFETQTEGTLQRIEGLALDGFVPLTVRMELNQSSAGWTIEYLAQ